MASGDLVKVVVTVRANDGAARQQELEVADPNSLLVGIAAVPEAAVNLLAELGGGWPGWGFDGTAYTLGRGWQGEASFALHNRSADGRVRSGVWRLGEEGGAYWRAERVTLMLRDEWLTDTWQLYIAPTSATPDLAADVVGLRRLALVLDSWLETEPAVGEEVSFACGNVAVMRPPAPNHHPHLDGWGTDSIYTKIKYPPRERGGLSLNYLPSLRR